MIPPTDYQAFTEARQMIEHGDTKAEGIAAMIHLSLNALPLQIRAWAARYLEERLNTSIERDDHETTGTTGNVR